MLPGLFMSYIITGSAHIFNIFMHIFVIDIKKLPAYNKDRNRRVSQ